MAAQNKDHDMERKKKTPNTTCNWSKNAISETDIPIISTIFSFIPMIFLNLVNHILSAVDFLLFL